MPLTFPVLIPSPPKQDNNSLQDLGGLLDLGNGLGIPQLSQNNIPTDMTVAPFLMTVDDMEGIGGDSDITLPPIPGIIAIPGNIGFLHQYFSVLSIVTNGAPTQSNLVIKNVQAKIILPAGDDLVPGTDDDPLRLATGAGGDFPSVMPVINAGPDGKYGTADDVASLNPGETGQADFTIEGLKEGTHKLEFEITATLEGLPIGPVTLKGKATGAVLVRNPNFAITLGHPATVRAGQEYDLFVTINNTGKTVANLVSLHLDRQALSGASFVAGETTDKSIETILPGASATVKYRLKAQLTGAVTATAFESDTLTGKFTLRAGVGDNNIPLSPDSLIIPYTDHLPSDLVSSTVDFLGQAWSVATAPAGALPSDLLAIPKSSVTSKATALSEAGMRVLFGDSAIKAVEDFSFDILGAEDSDITLDFLRRQSASAQTVNGALAAVFQQEIGVSGMFSFQQGLADKVSDRPGHISVITSDAPVRVRVTTAEGNAIGGTEGDVSARDIPFSDQIRLVDTGSSRSTLSLITQLKSASYSVNVSAEADASFDLGVVVPGAAGVLQQLRFSGVALPSGGKLRLLLSPGTDNPYRLAVDDNGDGATDRFIAPDSTIAIAPHAPHLLSAVRIVPGYGPGGDKHGRNLAVLFSGKVSAESAQDLTHYQIDGNAVMQAVLEPSGRMAFMLLRDGVGPFFDRSLTASGLAAPSGLAMPAPETTRIVIPAVSTPLAGIVSGTVRSAAGKPIPGATVRLYQYVWVDDGFTIESEYALISEKIAVDGSFQFDYVLQNDDPQSPFKIEAVNPGSNEVAQLITPILYDRQRLNLDLFMKARGNVTGTVRDGAGNPVGNARVQLVTVNDSRSYSATADGAGAFSFTGVSVGPFSLQAASDATASSGTVMGTIPDDGSTATRDVVIYPDAALPTASVSGHVLDPDGVTLRPGVVVIVSAAGNYQNWMRSNADGSFSFDGIAPGAVTLTANDLVTGESSVANLMVASGATARANLIMAGTGTVNGKVQRGGDKPVGGLYVIASVGDLKRVVQTDVAGSFSFAMLPVGQVRVEVLDPNDQNRTIVTGTVSLLVKGTTVNIVLYAPDKAFASGTIQGTVYHRNGEKWRNAAVRLLVSSTSFYLYVAKEDGSYAIPNLPLGTYKVVVQSDDTDGAETNAELVNANCTLWFDRQIQPLDLHPVPQGTVSGTIYDDAAKSTPTGANVVLTSLRPDRVGWLVYGGTTSVKSDPQTGKYLFSGVSVGNFSVSASNTFRPIPAVAGGALSADGESATVNLSLKGDGQVNALGSVFGKVLLPDGTAAGAGVKVTAFFSDNSASVDTDSDGAFRFGKIVPAGNRRIVAEDPTTTLTWQGDVSVPAGMDVPVNIRLLGRGTLNVQVLNADGTPAAGSGVIATGSAFPNDKATGATGADGVATLGNLSEGEYAVSAVDNQGHGGATTAQISVDKSTVPVTISLAPYGSVAGRFLEADGVSPVKGGQVKLLLNGRVVGYAASSSADADAGAFLVTNVPLGNFTLEGYDPRTERYGAGGGSLLANGATASANVVYIPIGNVQGRVLNNSGTAPVPGASVAIHSLRNYNCTTVAGPDGSFLFVGVPAVPFSIDASDPTGSLRGGTTGSLGYENETASAEIRLGPVGSVGGRVLMPDGVTPASNATVSIEGIGATQAGDADGSFRFDNLPAGRSYYVTARQNGTHRNGGGIFTVPEDGAVAIGDVTLQGVGSVQVKLFNSKGSTALEGAAVVLTAPSITETCSTDADGSCLFSEVPVGSFSTSATHPPDLAGASGAGVVSKEGETVAVTMTMGPVGTVTGKVFMPDGVTPSRGGGVRLDGGGMTFSGVTDSDGSFTFSGIPVPFSFSLRTEDAAGQGVAEFSGSILNNGDISDVGTLVLDDRRLSVTSVDPGNGTLNVPITKQLKVIFSAPADPATVTSSSVSLLQGGTQVTGTIQLDQDNAGATFTPSAPLKGFTLYTLAISDSITDRFGRALTEAKSFTFTTVDAAPPTLQSISPADGSVQVQSDQTVRLTFSEPLDSQSLGGVVLHSAAGEVTATRTDLIQNGSVVVLTPLEPLQFNSSYTVSVAGVRDLAGNQMAGSFQSAFATVDTVAPAITALSVPADAQLVKGSTVPFTATAPDADVAYVDFYQDDALVGTVQNGPFTLPILLNREGAVRYKAVAQDRFQNRGVPAYLELSVEATSPQVAANPPGGNYKAEQQVALSMDRGGDIFYTTDGSDPSTASALYSAPVPILLSGILKYFCRDAAGNKTAIRSETYVIDRNVPVTRSTPAAGYYASAQNVVLSCSDSESGCDATYYCLGSGCTPASPYLGAIQVDSSQVIRFYSKDKAGNAESLEEAAYTIGMSASVSPSSILSGYQGRVAFAVKNLSAAGSTVLVEQFVDANRNGVIDDGDYVVRSFSVTDGSASGNPNVQGDEDGAANSALGTSLSYFLRNDIYHAPGQYLFRATSGLKTTTAPFTVTAEVASQSISGAVSVGSATRPGALVKLTDKWQRPIGYALADENGQYTIQVKTAGEYLVTATSYGYATSAAATLVTVGAGEVVTGQNLHLVSGAYRVSGRVKDASTGTGIGGVWVTATGSDLYGVAITDSTGSYTLGLPAGAYSVAVAVDPTVPNPSARGYLVFKRQFQPIEVTADAAVPDISLTAADILLRGRVVSVQEIAAPGMPVQGGLAAGTDAREPVGLGVTNADGEYAVAVSSGSGWQLSLHDGTAQGLGYLGEAILNLSTATGPLAGNDLTIYPIAASVRGTVRDSDGNSLPGAEIGLRNVDSTIMATAGTAADGSYSIGTVAGTWLVDDVTHDIRNQSLEQATTVADGETSVVDFLVDVKQPSVAIDPVATPTTSDFETITGTVEAGASIAVTVDTAAVVGPVSYPTPTTWSCTVTGLVAGDNGNNITVTATDTVGNSATATAHITLVPIHTITASADANGSIAPSGIVTVPSGGEVTFTITPANGHVVAGVLVDGKSVGAVTSYLFTNVIADHTISATFAPDTCKLSYQAGPNGTISGATPQTLTCGSSGTPVTAVPAPCYHFVSWSDGVLTATRTDSNVQGINVIAKFEVNTYTLTYQAGTNGTISGITPQTVTCGSSGTQVKAVASLGYRFESWDDGVLTATRTDNNADHDLRVTAKFTAASLVPVWNVTAPVYGIGGAPDGLGNYFLSQYVMTSYVYRLNSSGVADWSSSTANSGSGYVIADKSGSVYSQNVSSQYVYKFTPPATTPVWATWLPYPKMETGGDAMTVDTNGYLYVTASQNRDNVYIYKIRQSDGVIVWSGTTTISAKVLSIVVDSHGMIYVTGSSSVTTNDLIYKYDPAQGTYPVATYPMAGITRMAIDSSDHLYGVTNKTAFKIDGAGNVLWSATPYPAQYSLTIATDGVNVYVGHDHYLWVYDANTGTLKQSITNIVTGITGDATLYVSTDGLGSVYAHSTYDSNHSSTITKFSLQ